MSDNYIDLVVTSPPYDNLRTYNNYVDKSWDESTWKPIISELSRVIKKGGVIVWVVSDATIEGSETGTSFKQALYFKECGLNLYDTMIWTKQMVTPTQSRYYNGFEYMFILSKDKPNYLNFIEDVKTKSYGRTYKSDKVVGFTKKGEKLGTQKDKIKTVREHTRRLNYWYIPIGQNKTNHPAIFPDNLAYDHIKTWSGEGCLVYDPFLGSGTTACMAKLLNRNYIGSEISKEYFKIAQKKLDQTQSYFF
jgi:site-specific DNA-methyltransferase (adenine-specific)